MTTRKTDSEFLEQIDSLVGPYRFEAAFSEAQRARGSEEWFRAQWLKEQEFRGEIEARLTAEVAEKGFVLKEKNLEISRYVHEREEFLKALEEKDATIKALVEALAPVEKVLKDKGLSWSARISFDEADAIRDALRRAGVLK